MMALAPAAHPPGAACYVATGNPYRFNFSAQTAINFYTIAIKTNRIIYVPKQMLKEHERLVTRWPEAMTQFHNFGNVQTCVFSHVIQKYGKGKESILISIKRLKKIVFLPYIFF